MIRRTPDGIDIRPADARAGHIAYTDGRAVYLRPGLPGDVERVLIKHECGHIWLEHARRSRQYPEVPHKTLNIAADMEIAALLYTAGDDAIITQPRGLLNGGIRAADAQQLAADVGRQLETFEEFVAALIERGDHQTRDDPLAGDLADAEAGSGGADTGQLIEAATQHAEALEAAFGDEALRQQHAEQTAGYRVTPSVSALMDGVLGRAVRPDPVSTYRRPSRRAIGGAILRGSISTPRPARVRYYVDRSGSFTPEKTAAAEAALRRLIVKYRGTVSHDTVYFSDSVGVHILTGRGTNYAAVADAIAADRPELAVVITDDDAPAGDLPEYMRRRTLVVPIGCKASRIAARWGAAEAAIHATT